MTKTTTTTEQIQIIQPDVTEVDEKIASLNAELATARTEGQQADQRADHLRNRLTLGDVSVTADDLIKADAEVSRAAYLIPGLENQIKNETSRRPATDLRLGESVATGLTKITNGPIYVVAGDLPTDAVETAPGDGALYVIVTGQPKESVSGVLSGEVELAFVRQSNRYGLDMARVGRRLKDVQVIAKTDSESDRTTGSTAIFTARILVETAFAEVPVIADHFISERGLTSAEIATRWAVRQGLFGATSDRMVVRSAEDASIITPKGNVSGGKVTEVDGLRYVEFTATFNGIMSQYSAKPGDALRGVVEDLPGLAIGNMGRITEAVGEVESDRSQGMPAWTVKIAATAVSINPSQG